MKKISSEVFMSRWREQHAEWERIRRELVEPIDDDDIVDITAFDVSDEQRFRAARDGRTLVTCDMSGDCWEVTPDEMAKIAEDANA